MFCDNTYDFNPQSSSGNIFEPKWHPVIDNGHSLHWEGSQVTDDTQKTGDNSSKLWLKLHSDLLLSRVYSTLLDSLLLYFSTVVLKMAPFALLFWHLIFLKICRNFHFNLKSSRIFGKRVISHILCAPKAKTLEMFQMFIQFISYKNFNILTVILIWKQSKLSFNMKGNFIK